MIKILTNKVIYFFLHNVLKKDRILPYLLDKEEMAAYSLSKSGYLHEIGWFESYRQEKPVDSKGHPVPWVTYPFLEFIEEKLHNEFVMFEYGSGNSTLYYSKKVKDLVTVEHDLTWFNQLEKLIPENVNLIHKSLEYNGNYAKTASTINQKFQVIIVDGRDRVNCCRNAISALAEDGVVVLDDSERPQYQSAIDYLKENEFAQLNFWGLVPGYSHRRCTSIFYRKNNCFAL